MTTTASQPAPADARRPRKRRNRPMLGAVLLAIGAVLTVAALGLLAFTVLGLAVLQSDVLARIEANNLSYYAEFGFVRREISSLTAMLAIPGILLVTAMSCLIPGYLLRRATVRSVPTTFWRGGSVLATYRPLAFWAHALWCLVPLAVWAALILLPLRSMIAGDFPAGIPDDNMTAVWLGLGSYGAVAAGVFGVMVTSLVKKAVYVRIATDHPDKIARGGRGIWRWITFRWRFDLWIAGVGAAFLGAGVIALGFEDLPFYLSTLAIGGVFFIGGMLLSLNYWRAGEPLGSGESYS
ncbi:hypothetical protein B0I08_10992 [Glaciihabitans tibetensis]|uniref:Uncharacterized protein n=1 Tax=Glaciihabitans tibetensis TaxID=1266600 RepID=A0A2T0V6X3_9MICO|nr:hypothetical protein [Glaciihabitans tibetensis]PRY65942.1 hypothetical protein B0I08_10992 [Glaciihabitans tibetensis]